MFKADAKQILPRFAYDTLPRKSQQKTSALAFYMLDSEYNASIGKVQPIL